MLTRLFPRMLLCAVVLGAALALPLAAHAQPIRITCKWSDAANDYTCKRSCTQKLPDGATVYYDDGTSITIVDANGKTTTFKCQDGNWVQTARTLPPKILGTFNALGTIAGLQGDVTQTTTIPTTDGNLITTITYFIGPGRPIPTLPCEPTDLTCPGLIQ